MQEDFHSGAPTRSACPDCGGTIPADAAACIHCGKMFWKIANSDSEPRQLAKGYSLLMLGATVIVIALVVLAVVRFL